MALLIIYSHWIDRTRTKDPALPQVQKIQLTIENWNCQGTKKIVRVIESSSFREMGLKQ